MTMSTPNNPLPAVSLGQIVQDLQSCQQDIIAHCTDSSQQLQAAMEQLQALSQFISTTMSVLQTAYDGLAVLQNKASAGAGNPSVAASPPAVAQAPAEPDIVPEPVVPEPVVPESVVPEPTASIETKGDTVGNGDSAAGRNTGDNHISETGQNIVESIKGISALLTASAQKPAQQ